MQNDKDRGMIKWRPFASLPEHMELIEEKNKKRNKLNKVRISNDKMEEINYIVENSIKNSTKLVLKLYKNGEIVEKIGIPLYFDWENKQLILKNNNSKERIKIIDIVDAIENY